MTRLMLCIHASRITVLCVSLVSFIIHLSQCILSSIYQQKAGIPDWISAGHWQYLLWYISLGLSLVGGSAICISSYYYKRSKKYTLDKSVGILAIIPIISSIITAMMFNTIEPWTNGLLKIERSSSQLIMSCSLFDIERDKFYPLLYQRCLLSDLTWIFSILLCIIWGYLVMLTMHAAKQKKRNVVLDKQALIEQTGEPKWGRYIPDPPSSIYSGTTLYGNRSGLLTPSISTLPQKKNDYYYSHTNSSLNSTSRKSRGSNPSSPFDNYYGKGGDYFFQHYPHKSHATIDGEKGEMTDGVFSSSTYNYQNDSDYYSSYGSRRSSSSFPSARYSYGDNDRYKDSNNNTDIKKKTYSPVSDSFMTKEYRSPSYNNLSKKDYYSYSTTEKKQTLRVSTANLNKNIGDNGSLATAKTVETEPASATTPLYYTFARKSNMDFSLR